MAKDSNIPWCNHTVNFWWGCTEDSPACVNCYAREYDRLRGPTFDQGQTHWGADAPRWMRDDKAASELIALDNSARKRGVVEKIFVNSMSDTFEGRDDLNGARFKLFDTAEARTNLDILLLTKRPQNVAEMVPPHWTNGHWPGNVWLGFTGENQFWFDRRWAAARRIPAPVIFCSYEPACGPLVLPPDFLVRRGQAWLIAGGESGRHRRDWDLAWLDRVAAQCVVAGVPLFVKQDSSLHPDQQGRIADVLWMHRNAPVGQMSLTCKLSTSDSKNMIK